MPRSPLDPLPYNEFDYGKAMHLLNRAGFGGVPAQVQTLASLGPDKAVRQLVEYGEIPVEPVPADRFDAGIMRPRTAAERAALRQARQNGNEAAVNAAREQRQQRQREDRRQMRHLQRWWLNRMLETPRPLEEKMTLFWHGHFATGYRAIEDSYHMFRQNQLFRAHATGSFRELTHGVIRDPAMLRYLNNNRNVRRAPNENLARELMELFTLGEGNGYTERDIKEAARALTGYTFDDDAFMFRRRQHDDGTKRVLGRSGAFDGDDLVEIILATPVAAEFICWKLYRYFVNDGAALPTGTGRAVIEAMAKLLRSEEFRIGPVLGALFRSRHFYEPQHMASMIKSPAQLAVQAVRTLRVPVRSDTAILDAMDLMGQNIFHPPSVKGWSGGRRWINTATMYVRQNLLVYLLTGRAPDTYDWPRDDTPFDATHLLSHLSGPEAATADRVTYLLRFCLGREPDPRRAAVLIEFADGHGGRFDNDMIIALLALITAMPEYQLC